MLRRWNLGIACLFLGKYLGVWWLLKWTTLHEESQGSCGMTVGKLRPSYMTGTGQGAQPRRNHGIPAPGCIFQGHNVTGTWFNHVQYFANLWARTERWNNHKQVVCWQGWSISWSRLDYVEQTEMVTVAMVVYRVFLPWTSNHRSMATLGLTVWIMFGQLFDVLW